MRKPVIYLTILFISAAFQSSIWAQSKSPATAGALSAIIPGAGQMYNGEGQKGFYFLSIYASALTLAIVTSPSTWEDAPDDPTGGFFDDLNPGGTSGTIKAIFYGSAAVAGATPIWSVLDAVSVAKDSETRPPKYSANVIPILASQNKGVLLTAQIRF